MSIKLKYFLSSLLLCAILLMTIGVIGYRWITDIMRENANNTYQSLLDDTVANIDREFESIQTFALGLSETAWVKRILDMKTERIDLERVGWMSLYDYNQQMDINKITSGFMDEIALYFRDKDVVISSLGQRSAKTFFEYNFIIQGDGLPNWQGLTSAHNPGTVYTQVHISSFAWGSREGMLYIRSIPTFQVGPAKGSIMVFVSNASIKRLLGNMMIAPGIQCQILDGDGEEILHFPEEDGVECAFEPFADPLHPDGKAIGRRANKDYLLESRSRQLGLFYRVSIPEEVILSDLKMLKTSIVSLLFVIFTAISIVAYQVARLTHRPLKRIIDEIRTSFAAPDDTVQNEYEWLKLAINAIVSQEETVVGKLAQHYPVLRNAYLLRLAEGKADQLESDLKALRFLNVDFDGPSFLCAAICIKNYDTSILKITAMLEGLKVMGVSCHHFEDNGKYMLLLNFFEDGQCDEFLRMLESNLREDPFHGNVSIVGVGGMYRRLEDIALSYREALATLDYRPKSDKYKLLFYRNINLNVKYFYYPVEEELKITNSLHIGDYEAALDVLDKLVTHNVEAQEINIRLIRNFFSSVGMTIMKVIDGYGKRIRLDPELDMLDRMDRVQMMHKHMAGVFRALCEEIMQLKDTENQQFINTLKAFVDDNIADHTLSLTMLASKFGMGTSYLSRYFKEHLSETFISYVSRKRIELAKNLLTSSDMEIKAIAHLCGYDSDASFRRAFKREENISPNTYRVYQKANDARAEKIVRDEME